YGVLLLGQTVQFWSHLTGAPSSRSLWTGEFRRMCPFTTARGGLTTHGAPGQ
ncbi:unnamed protein product, partial [Staurois parvus]